MTNDQGGTENTTACYVYEARAPETTLGNVTRYSM